MSDEKKKEILNGSAVWELIENKGGAISKVTVKEGYLPFRSMNESRDA